MSGRLLSGNRNASCAAHNGSTRHFRPTSWPQSPSAVSTDTTPERRSPGTTTDAEYDACAATKACAGPCPGTARSWTKSPQSPGL
ncbi:hypothetical protein [Streptomyces sp. NPDC002640]